jgi:S-formylglutathione hydrolase FrmB
VSAQSAALILDSPKNLNAASKSGAPIVRTLGAVFGEPIDAAHWEANSVFALAKRNGVGLRRVAIYFNCGQNDDYGFEKGAAALDRELAEEQVPHEYHAYPGDHSLNYFLLHFTETLEFHSRAFGAGK